MERYIRTRIEQLSDDRDKAHDEHDKQWYTRCIQELDWVLMMGEKKPKRNCSQEYLKEKQANIPDCNFVLVSFHPSSVPNLILGYNECTIVCRVHRVLYLYRH
jgi:hypothetical protein